MTDAFEILGLPRSFDVTSGQVAAVIGSLPAVADLIHSIVNEADARLQSVRTLTVSTQS